MCLHSASRPEKEKKNKKSQFFNFSNVLLIFLPYIHINENKILNIDIDDQAAMEVALRSRGTPRIANSLLRRVRDFAMVKGGGHVNLEITRYALNALNIDSRGLDQMDNKILTTIININKRSCFDNTFPMISHLF